MLPKVKIKDGDWYVYELPLGGRPGLATWQCAIKAGFATRESALQWVAENVNRSDDRVGVNKAVQDYPCESETEHG